MRSLDLYQRPCGHPPLYQSCLYSSRKPHTDDQVNAAINAGTFASPSSNLRPRFRYWAPDASVNHTRLTLDIAEAGRIGAGGVEVLGYYLHDSAPGNYVPVSWSTYGWGTEEWKEVFRTLAQAYKDGGLIMDAALGPNQGAGVPAEVDAKGLLWDLVMNRTTVEGGKFGGVVPGWGRGVLQAAVVGEVVESVNTTGPAPGLFGASASAYGVPRIQNILATDSLQDVTSMVGADGTLNLQLNATTSNGTFTLFTFYFVHSELREQESPLLQGPQTPPQNFVQNGSWIVDHFSTLGAQTTIDFWENYLLHDADIGSLLTDVRKYLWEGSVEIAPTLYWTQYLPQRFLAGRR